MTKRKLHLLSAGTLGLVLVGAVGMGSAAVAADGDSDGIPVHVDIDSITPEGSLSMTVADGGVELTEDGSTDDVRQFTGTTPTVTVTDNRAVEDIPDGVAWAVVGQASEFTDADDASKTIGPEYLGWTPALLSESSTGEVAAGEPVSSVEDDGSGAPTVGLEGQELLVSTFGSADETGSWDVNADLALRTPADVEAGSYSSTLTLTLMEQ
ncbi:hypothetical protein [Cellulomonas sp. PhB143]|uniref:hypothetical protein n=1 Tax=Cellulomonas sp. PhB143 TaxID=2485186 RepID=UPI000FA1688C|nr:hypothetical protein [Cellulomonas sp. PhB143]ROS72145.1 hypothetical protein EDF32_2889 [Cellulomonas sp. PhB143]